MIGILLTDLKLEETYDFDDFKFYIYKLNLNNSIYEKKYSQISNFNNYLKDISKFDKEIFVFDQNLKGNVKICDVKRVFDNKNSNSIEFEISTNTKCLVIFPITFSLTNDIFYNDKINFNKKCKTFRAQYYFHACFFNQNSNVKVKKKNLITYPLYSFLDFLNSRKLKIIK